MSETQNGNRANIERYPWPPSEYLDVYMVCTPPLPLGNGGGGGGGGEKG